MIEKREGRARNLLNVYICLEDLFQTGNLNVFIAFSSPFYGSFPGTDRKSSSRIDTHLDLWLLELRICSRCEQDVDFVVRKIFITLFLYKNSEIFLYIITVKLSISFSVQAF